MLGFDTKLILDSLTNAKLPTAIASDQRL
jgi:hypothetical protein